jgi:hypothetical protein
MKNIVLTVIIVLLLLFALSNLGAFIAQSDFWQSRYGMYSTGLQMEFAFWILMLIVVFVGVIYLWWKKAI